MAVADSTQLRETIRQSFRKACLKRLEGHEAEAVKILQEELPSKIKEWKLSDDCRPGEMEALLGEELARTESAHWVVKETEARLKKNMDGVLSASQAEAMQSVVSAKMQMELSAFKNKLDSAVSEMLTVQGAEAIGSRISQELSERIRTMVAQAFEAQKGHLAELPSKEELDRQIDEIRSGLGTHLQGIAQKVVTTEIVEELLRENFAAFGAQMNERLRAMIAEGIESQKGVLEELPSKAQLDKQLDEIQAGLGDHLQGISKKVATTEIVEELLRRNLSPIAAAQSQQLTASSAEVIVGRISQEMGERLRVAVDTAIASHKGVLEELPSKEDLDKQIDAIRSGLGTHLNGIAQKVVTTEIVEELLRENLAPLNVQIDSVKVISENSASALAGEIAGYEKREMSRWADRQGIWARMFEGLLRKNELEAALWQVQNAIGERIEGKVKNWEGFAGEVKTLLSEGLQKLVSAEAFEARLMTSVNMLHEAQAKALQENSVSIKAALEKRLTETSGPIFQRVSSLITYADWERVTRDVNEKLANQLTAEIGNKVEEQSEAQLRNMRALVEHQNQSGTHTALLENLRAFSERLAALTLETAEQQKTLLKSVQKEIADQQTQSLGLLSMQQQNFLGNLQRDWDGLKKSLEEIKVRQIALEADLRGVTSAVENRLRDQTQLVQSELNAMHHRLENGLTEVFSKKMKNIRVVTD